MVPTPAATFVTRRLGALHRGIARWYPNLELHKLQVTVHSLRIGGTSWAEERGVPREHLMTHGRWTSDAVDVYRIQAHQSQLALTALM